MGRAEEARPVIAVEFEIDDEERGGSGTLEKAFRGAKGTVRLEVDGETITDPTLADQALAELTGIPTRGASSARRRRFATHELADLDRATRRALRDRLQASISGADRGTVARPQEAREGALRPRARRATENPGRLKVAEEAVEHAQAAVEQGELALAQLERDRDTLSGAHERRAETETALAERRSCSRRPARPSALTAERDRRRRSGSSATARRSTSPTR